MIRAAGDAGLLVELEPVIDAAVNARALAIAAAVRGAALPGVRDVVPACRSVAIHLDTAADARALTPRIAALADSAVATEQGRDVEVPIVYDGVDLDAVATRAGLSPQAVADRHAAGEYRVFMLGFLPGFPYMGPVDAAIAAPRHATPRLRVPAGSVGIAGRQTGIYPLESPGGWQIIGRTPLPMFDASRDQPATLMPGDRVRFVRDEAPRKGAPYEQAPREGAPYSRAPLYGAPPAITVLAPGLFTTIQDDGRWGYQALGVPVGGALDQRAYARANRLVGNAAGAAVIEATILGPELRFERRTSVAITGADLSPTLDGRRLPINQQFECPAGAVLRFGPRLRGARAYIAVAGGIDVPMVLGSRSTHALTGLGGRPLRAGDTLTVGDAPASAGRGAPDVEDVAYGLDSPVTLRVRRGPQAASLPADTLGILGRSSFRLSSRSIRLGYRLEGASLPAPP
ncbi:MAG: 5-oxoprolinase subunit PxpB, partial [Vicinamibacterales bacterium]